MFKTQRCLHSDSEAFVGQTYLIKQEKRGGRWDDLFLCHKKTSSHTLQNDEYNQDFCSKITNRDVNQSAGVQRQTTHAEKCTEIMRDFFFKKAPSPA